MTPVTSSSLIKSVAGLNVASITPSSSEVALPHAPVHADDGLRPQEARRKQEIPQTVAVTQLQECTNEQMVAVTTSGSSVVSDGGGSQNVSLVTDGVTNDKTMIEKQMNPRATADVIKSVIRNQLNEDVVLSTTAANSDFSRTLSMKKETLEPVMSTISPSRAAAAAGMTRQLNEETGSLEMLLSSGVELEDMEPREQTIPSSPKKKRSEGLSRGLKRSRKVSTKLLQHSFDNGTNRQHLVRGKKKQRRQAGTSTGILDNLLPMNGETPSRSCTSTSSERRVKGKRKPKSKQNVRNKTKQTHAVREMNTVDTRQCEYCKKVANICVLMHCQVCHRVYHAKCLLHAFKPYVDESVPIFDQMERLQLESPERRGNIFRCSSCKAVFLDFYASSGYMWDCDCPTCSQPEKIVMYRRMKLIQMMNDLEQTKQRKKDQKKSGTVKAGRKSLVSTPSPLISTPSRLKTIPRSRRIRGSSTTPDRHAASLQKVLKTASETRDESLNDHEMTALGAVGKLEQPMLVGDDLVRDVHIVHDNKISGWCFPVMCSRTTSCQESSVTKTGKCTWFPKQNSLVRCNCCDKEFSVSEFVYHTDSSLVINANAANEESMRFVFVTHRNGAQHTSFEQFQVALRTWSEQQIAKDTSTIQSDSAKQKMIVSTETPAITMTTSDTVTLHVLQSRVSRLQTLALFKQPKDMSVLKSLTEVHSIDTTSLDFVAQVVCLSPSYVITMQNGTHADRVVRSRTTAPGDSFPRKAGWLLFTCSPVSVCDKIICYCCEQAFDHDEFVGHAGIAVNTRCQTSRDFLYAVEREDEAALVPFQIFLTDLEVVTANSGKMFFEEVVPLLPH